MNDNLTPDVNDEGTETAVNDDDMVTFYYGWEKSEDSNNNNANIKSEKPSSTKNFLDFLKGKNKKKQDRAMERGNKFDVYTTHPSFGTQTR